ncbi:MAG TPA: SRPBCC domain-containing protein [Candidatus Thermoplasmatota archaeon]|nr:SRPBCC domain-containing protein [Candidatus Thermoplasmatota archaeon]
MTTKKQVLKMERVFDCTLDEMWAAWTDPELFKRWITPFPGIDAEIHEMDVRVGGRLRFTMIDATGKRYPEEVGEYEVVRKPHEIVTFSANEGRGDVFEGEPQRMKGRFEAVGPSKTKVHFETDLPGDFPIEMAKGGFGSCFNKLETMLHTKRAGKA